MIKWNVFFICLFVLSGQARAQVAYIDDGVLKQYIDGFGASTAWHGQLSESEADATFGNDNDNQMGLSILRIRIDPNGAYADEMNNAKKALARGAIVLASPWSPPASMKTNNNTTGGELDTAFYDDYAAYLNTFDDYMSTNGAPLYAISLQNEPDIEVPYESCNWSPAQMVKFLREQGPSINNRIVAPESFQFRRAMSDPILNDSAACANLDIVGGHIYGGGLASYPLAEEKGKKIWMTEHYINNDDIRTCVSQFSREIIDCMKNNMNAFIWWYLRQPDCNLINRGGAFKKKGYAMAHFSKFIRPGYYRIDATYSPQTGIYLVAFKGEETVIVVINASQSAKDQTFKFNHDSIAYVKWYTTSETKNLNNNGTLEIVDSTFTVNLEGTSIATFISTDTPSGIKPADSSIPKKYDLKQNYPNPFNSETAITFNLPSYSFVQLKVFDIMGRKIASLADGYLAAGYYSYNWNASNLSDGVYFYRLTTNSGFSHTRKMILSK